LSCLHYKYYSRGNLFYPLHSLSSYTLLGINREIRAKNGTQAPYLEPIIQAFQPQTTKAPLLCEGEAG
ncbi:MAG: hypothetical protein NT023_17520, partial [Armatimonadetes bacterium]|nr:hypothetical protein [Armatimonadota bacterium]